MVDVVNNIRIIEDSFGFMALTIAMIYLFYAAVKIRKTLVGYIPFSLILGFTPLYVWKFLGAVNRAFVDKATSPELSAFLGDAGEVFEALSGLILALTIIYILLRLKGVICKKEESQAVAAPITEALKEESIKKVGKKK